MPVLVVQEETRKKHVLKRIFSVRDEFGQWDPKLQRPELWDIFNGRIHKGENVRVFPISNWTELDVWNYIRKERIELPSIYFSHDREVVDLNGQWIANSEYASLDADDRVTTKEYVIALWEI